VKESFRADPPEGSGCPATVGRLGHSEKMAVSYSWFNPRYGSWVSRAKVWIKVETVEKPQNSLFCNLLRPISG
jgi:hypothetical protein